MRKMIFAALWMLLGAGFIQAQTAIDMQAPMTSAEAQVYTVYQTKQAAYYTGRFHQDTLLSLSGEELFARLNELMGATIQLDGSSYSYNSLRDAYIGVDRDLNNSSNIIGYYDGRSMNGTWDSGSTYNREHTWPQSKGANKSIPMGYDMQSVRPTSTSVNGDRGNVPYGESTGYYDPNDVTINNPAYRTENNGSYRGDAARIILYDYIVYGSVTIAGVEKKNKMYNGNAQLLQKLGQNGVFESVEVMVSWNEQDAPSLTEMVRNDGAQDYQGNRNPFIDFPQLVRRLLLPDTLADIEQQATQAKARKVIRDGQIIIIHDGVEYDLIGNVINR